MSVYPANSTVAPDAKSERKDKSAPAVKLVSCILREESVDEALELICRFTGVGGVTLTNVRGFDPRSGLMTQYRGIVYPLTMTLRVRLDVAVPSEQVEELIRELRSLSRTGKTGDGKIIVTDVDHIERIRTGEIGLSAI